MLCFLSEHYELSRNSFGCFENSGSLSVSKNGRYSNTCYKLALHGSLHLDTVHESTKGNRGWVMISIFGIGVKKHSVQQFLPVSKSSKYITDPVQ